MLRVVAGGEITPPPDVLPQVEPPGASPLQQRLAFTAEELAIRATELTAWTRAVNTRRAYDSDWKHFETWCNAQKLPALPASPDTVRLYLTAYGDPGAGADLLTAATLKRRMSAITQHHREAGKEPPTHTDAVRMLLLGIRRAQAEYGITTQKAAVLSVDEIREIVAAMPVDSQALWPRRDRAIILMGFALGSRPSELVALNVADIDDIERSGLLVHIRKSKTDQAGLGRNVAIKYGVEEQACPVLAYREWIAGARIDRGPVFRYVDRHNNVSPKRLSAQSIADTVQNACLRAGIDAKRIQGRTLRRSLITEARNAKADRTIIAETTGHRNMSVMDGYMGAQRSLFEETAASIAGL